ncbi:hypothetical protein AAFF_G00373510 [Aldrovandia affinis]|uniref:Secreted protein n=1 Tax=Aldrovandia affinis TaxID=143900 RepID=A0AAD7WM43_9TELE|nr:hypothetical protein AAFF_G00373510 [Aldrovandia affinis]
MLHLLIFAYFSRRSCCTAVAWALPTADKRAGARFSGRADPRRTVRRKSTRDCERLSGRYPYPDAYRIPNRIAPCAPKSTRDCETPLETLSLPRRLQDPPPPRSLTRRRDCGRWKGRI